MIRLAAILALLPVAALADAVKAPEGVYPPLRADEPIPSYITTVPPARHQLPEDILDAMRNALVAKMGGTVPEAESKEPKAAASGH